MRRGRPLSIRYQLRAERGSRAPAYFIGMRRFFRALPEKPGPQAWSASRLKSAGPCGKRLFFRQRCEASVTLARSGENAGFCVLISPGRYWTSGAPGVGCCAGIVGTMGGNNLTGERKILFSLELRWEVCRGTKFLASYCESNYSQDGFRCMI